MKAKKPRAVKLYETWLVQCPTEVPFAQVKLVAEHYLECKDGTGTSHVLIVDDHVIKQLSKKGQLVGLSSGATLSICLAKKAKKKVKKIYVEKLVKLVTQKEEFLAAQKKLKGKKP